MAGGAGIRSGAGSAACWAHNPPRRAHARPLRPRIAVPKPRGHLQALRTPMTLWAARVPQQQSSPEALPAATLHGPAHRGSAETPAGYSVGRTELLRFSF